MREHGTRSTYVNEACRCQPCRQAHATYTREWRHEQARLAKLGRAVEQAVKRSNKPTKKGNTA